METSPTIAVLAGGESRRMGTDKALLTFGGEALLVRTVRAALASGYGVLVVGRERPAEWPASGVRFLADTMPGQGPLGGLATVLAEASGPVALVACDLPLVGERELAWLAGLAKGGERELAGLAEGGGEDGVAVVNGSRIEPLFSLYRPAVLPLVHERLAAGRRSLVGLIEDGRFAREPAPEEVARALVNVNTPEDLAALASLGYPEDIASLASAHPPKDSDDLRKGGAV